MAVVAKKPIIESNGFIDKPSMKISKEQDELTIHISSSFEQVSPMTDEMKEDKRSEGPALQELFNASLQERGDYPLENAKWIEDNVVEVAGLSKMTLHNFILKAEALGKTVRYTRKLTVEITD